MYAIVKTGGKQYRVEKGQTLLVERLPEDAGATVTLQPLMVRSDQTVFDAEGLAKSSVEAKILEHLRGPKIRVFKFKPKSGYKRTAGHRQELTRIEVTEILAGAGKKAAAKKAKVDKPAAEPEAPVAEVVEPAVEAPEAVVEPAATAEPVAEAPPAPAADETQEA